MVLENRVQSQVDSYQRRKIWYLMPPCLRQFYKVNIKGLVDGEVPPTQYIRVVAIEKGASGLPRLRLPIILI